MKTAVIYARYSSDSQTEQSIEGQLRVCEEYAQRNNIIILDTYIDRAMTGTNDNRPDFQRMLKDSSKKEWNYVLVYKLDRFSRNKYETTIHKHTLALNGVKVLSAMENIPDTPEGIILESLLEGMNQYYSAELAQKVKRGMYESRLKGHFTGGILPYGYKLDGKKIIIDEDTAEVVRFMYKQYSLDMPVSKIISTLTEKGILHKNKPFKTTTVQKIFRNEKYTGKYKLNGKEFDNMFPQIIDEELFEKVRKKNELKRYGKNSVRETYLFRNKLICGYCGKPISAETSRTRNKTKLNYYKCLGIKKYKNGCPKETVRQEILEEFLIETILTELKKPDTMNNIVKGLIEFQNNFSNNSNLNLLLKNKNQTEKSLNNVMNAIEQGIINSTTNKRMKELEEQIEKIEREIVIEKSKMNIKINEEEIKAFYESALKKEPKILINYLIKEIKLYNDKVEITFNNPTIKSPNNQGFSFLSLTKFMSKYIHHNLQPNIIKMKIIFYI